MFVASVDQGTTSSRVIIFDAHGSVITQHQEEFPSIYPQEGWCEHDPLVIWKSVQECMKQCVLKFQAMGYGVKDIRGLGITNQRETTVVWDRLTGEPLCHAIVWLDARTSETVAHLVSKTPDHSKDALRVGCCLKHLCGLPITTYFSAVKLRWLLDNVSAVRMAADDGRLCFGTVDSWLIYKLSGHQLHVTDVTNASRTMFMDLKTLKWSQELCSFFDIPMSILPEIRSSSEVYEYVHGGPMDGVAIAGCLGDQQAALVGQRCFHPGDAKNTYGTGCFMLLNTGEMPALSRQGLLTTVAYQLGPQSKPCYALEGSIAIAGAAIKWLRDNLGIIKESKEIGPLAAKVKSTAGVYFLPAFTGLFAPHWTSETRGTIVGLSQYTNTGHIARAVLEAISFQTKEIFEAMIADSNVRLRSLKVDGGVTNSDEFVQIQSDILAVPVERPEMRETTALGAALAAGLATGVWSNVHELASMKNATFSTFQPEQEDIHESFKIWTQFVHLAKQWPPAQQT